MNTWQPRNFHLLLYISVQNHQTYKDFYWVLQMCVSNQIFNHFCPKKSGILQFFFNSISWLIRSRVILSVWLNFPLFSFFFLVHRTHNIQWSNNQTTARRKNIHKVEKQWQPKFRKVMPFMIDIRKCGMNTNETTPHPSHNM